VAPSDRAELKLDVFDLANAALEVMWASDDPQRTRLIRLQGMDVVRYATGTLATLAAARPQFGGRLTAGAEQDAVACRAYSTLAALTDTRVEGSSGSAPRAPAPRRLPRPPTGRSWTDHPPSRSATRTCTSSAADRRSAPS